MINVEGATKRYGDTLALNNVSLNVSDSTIYCLLGRNGAGKTTLLKSIAGHIKLTEGSIEVDGKRVDTFNMPQSLTFLEATGKQFNMKIRDLIKYSAYLTDGFDVDFALKIADEFKLGLDKKYSKLSFGMKTMVSTLLSIASSSKVVILDEPVLGLDAIMRDRFYTLLHKSLLERPRIIIISTHLIDEISKVCEKIIIIDNGKILDYFNIAELDDKGYSLTGMTTDVENAIKGLKVISKKTIGGFTVASIFDKRINQPKGCNIMGLGLQDYFIALVGEDNANIQNENSKNGGQNE